MGGAEHSTPTGSQLSVSVARACDARRACGGVEFGEEGTMSTIHALVGAREVVTVHTETTVQDAARLMAARQIGAVPVLGRDSLAGIFTERDLMCRVVAAGLDPSSTTVGEVMTSQLVTAHPGESHQTCLERMQRARVRHLVVLDAQRQLTGIVSLRDLLAFELDDKTATLTFLNAYVS
jgi:CBS domain-containing protein